MPRPPGIPITDPQRHYISFKARIDAAVQSVLESGRYVLGHHVESLEREVAEYCGAAHAVAVASGTDALHLALRACGIGEGDEVIVSPFTFAGTAEAITYTGASPAWVDIDPETFTLDPAQIEAALTPRTRAVLPVHLYGHTADVGPIAALCEQHDLHLIEDCAQALGAEYRGRRAGALGSAACLSFYPTKNLGAFGDGGMVLTDDPALAEAARMLRNHGSEGGHRHTRIGYNSRLDEVQAAALRVKLPRLDELNGLRRERAEAYNDALGDLVTVPHERPGCTHVYNLYTVRCRDREALADHLAARGIGCAVHYRVPLHLQEAFGAWRGEGRLGAAERAANEVLSLPMFPELRPGEIAEVCEAVAAFAGGARSLTGAPAG